MRFKTYFSWSCQFKRNSILNAMLQLLSFRLQGRLTVCMSFDWSIPVKKLAISGQSDFKLLLS